MIVLFAGILSLSAVFYFLGQHLRFKNKSDLESAVESLEHETRNLQQQNSGLLSEKEGIIKQGMLAEEKISRWEEIKSDHKNLTKMKEELDAFILEESNRIDALERRRAEIAKQIREAEDKLNGYPLAIFGTKEEWEEYIKKRMDEFDELLKKNEDASIEKDGLVNYKYQLAEDVSRLKSRNDELKEQVDKEEQRVKAIIEKQMALLKPEHERLIEENEKLKEDITKAQEKLALLATVGTVESATISFPEDPISVAIKEGSGDKETDKQLAAFRDTPACLEGYDTQRELQDEEDELKEFKRKLDESGLKYPIRIIKAFHTSLKVNDLSPLTVLSGLSGTGKSQLPKAYASYFGIHFLHVPVEPGWDSPQDLLGFYDFVSERYRPTDRAKALGHFDQDFAKDLKITKYEKWQKRMLLILLDEMNLARTEYYFSEFLSRLEMRGKRSLSGNHAGSDARIIIDLPYSEKEKSKSLYVPHNVLWVGTLNEDETTQALSDKVLDRANSIRFASPSPDTLYDHSKQPDLEPIKKANNGYLAYEDWLKWSESKSKEEAIDKEIKENLTDLAELMQVANRAFGYRITQSIMAYIKRYPDRDWKKPMIDQINMRLLPKLSGCELNECQDSLEILVDLCVENLEDDNFSEAINAAIKDSDTTQIFNWPGYTYDEHT